MRCAPVLLACILCASAHAADPEPHPDTAAPADAPGPSLDALVARAQLCAVKQDWAQSAELYHEILERDPERADAWRGLGYVLRKQGQGSEARSAYEKALELAPADPDTLLGLGETYVSVGRKDDAKMLLEKLREIDKRNAATLEWVIRTGKAR